MAAQCGVKGRNSKPALLLLKSRARWRLIVHKMHMAAVILMMLAQTVVVQTLRERVRADKWCRNGVRGKEFGILIGAMWKRVLPEKFRNRQEQ